MALVLGNRYPARFAGYTAAGDPLYNVLRGETGFDSFWAVIESRAGGLYTLSLVFPIASGGWSRYTPNISITAEELNGQIITYGIGYTPVVRVFLLANGLYRFKACECRVLPGVCVQGTVNCPNTYSYPNELTCIVHQFESSNCATTTWVGSYLLLAAGGGVGPWEFRQTRCDSPQPGEFAYYQWWKYIKVDFCHALAYTADRMFLLTMEFGWSTVSNSIPCSGAPNPPVVTSGPFFPASCQIGGQPENTKSPCYQPVNCLFSGAISGNPYLVEVVE